MTITAKCFKAWFPPQADVFVKLHADHQIHWTYVFPYFRIRTISDQCNNDGGGGDQSTEFASLQLFQRQWLSFLELPTSIILSLLRPVPSDASCNAERWLFDCSELALQQQVQIPLPKFVHVVVLLGGLSCCKGVGAAAITGEKSKRVFCCCTWLISSCCSDWEAPQAAGRSQPRDKLWTGMARRWTGAIFAHSLQGYSSSHRHPDETFKRRCALDTSVTFACILEAWLLPFQEGQHNALAFNHLAVCLRAIDTFTLLCCGLWISTSSFWWSPRRLSLPASSQFFHAFETQPEAPEPIYICFCFSWAISFDTNTVLYWQQWRQTTLGCICKKRQEKVLSC